MEQKSSITSLMSSFGRAYHSENAKNPIFDDFKAQHPIRTYDNVEKAQGTFKIYQLPGGEKYNGIRFEGMEQLKKDGVQLNKDDYELEPVAGSILFV